MTGPSTKVAPDGQTCWDVPKQRNCLRCGTSYRSEWSGERICPRCKSTKAWRDGGAVRSSSSYGSR